MTDSKEDDSKKGAPVQTLREQAEEILAGRESSAPEKSSRQLTAMLHELQTHQIELELQNTRLVESQLESQHAYQRYRDLWEHAPTAYLTIDSSWRVAQVNLAGRRLFGRTSESLRKKRFVTLLHSDDIVPVHLMLERCLAGGATEQRELRIKRLDGGERQCLMVCYTPESLPGEEFILVTLTDFTERKQAEEALRQSENNYRELVQNANSAIVRWDRNGKIVFFNEYAQGFFGYTAKEVVGRSVSVILPQNDSNLGDVADLVRAIVEDPEKYAYNVNENVCWDGRRVWMAWTNKAIRDESGQVREILAIGSDITALKQAEDALAKREEQLRLALKAGGIGLWDRNMVTGQIEWSMELYELLGRKPEGPPINGETFFEYVHPEDIGRVRARVDEWLAAANEVFQDEFRVVRGDGQVRWLASVGQAYQDENGQTVRLLGINYDVTAQKEHEEQLRRTKAEAEDANQAKDRFLANMSHELRTPLSGIIGLADVLATRLRKPENQYYIRMVKESALSLNELLNEVLDSARIKAGEMRISKHPFNPRQLIGRVVGLFQERAKAEGNRIRNHIDPALPVLLSGDEERLEQVLRNLVSNAVKFTRNGTIMVSAECRFESPENATVTFRVRDNGPGIPPEKQAQLFDEFFQADNHLTKEHPGTGLGLSIARKLVQAMNGLIWVESKEGEGATFLVEIGLGVPADQTEKIEEVSEELEISLSQPLHVLVAEDNRINRTYIKRMLENLGHRVTMVENGLDAVNALKATHYDAVLMDIQMPVMDGYTAIRHIRESDLFNRNLPIYALTAYASEKDVEKALNAGADGHIVKPVDFEELQWILQQTAGKTVAEDMPRAERLFPTHQEILDRFSKNPSLYLELCQKIRGDLPQRMAKLQEMMACGDVNEAARECHSLSGIGATIGHEILWRAGLDSENELKESSNTNDNPTLEKMESAVAHTMQYLDDLTAHLSELTIAPHD